MASLLTLKGGLWGLRLSKVSGLLARVPTLRVAVLMNLGDPILRSFVVLGVEVFVVVCRSPPGTVRVFLVGFPRMQIGRAHV